VTFSTHPKDPLRLLRAGDRRRVGVWTRC